MISIIFLLVAIIFSITLFFTNESALKYNKNMILGVTLPYSLLDDTSVKSIINKYKKYSRLLILLFLVLFVPILIVRKYPSFSIIYLFTWIGILLLVNNRLYIKYFKELFTLKKKYTGDTDDDEYWEKGYYYNPNDTRVSVEKRIGYGRTFNMANKKAKIMTFITYASTIALILFLSIMFIIFDTSEFKLTIDGDIARISAPVYGYSFNINDVIEVKKIDTLPKGARTNGASTEKYNLGNYNLNNYGKSKMYVYNENPPFIAIKLNNLYVFLNGKTKDDTERYYNMLLERVK